MHINLVEIITIFLVVADGGMLLYLTARINRLGRAFPRPPEAAASIRALNMARISIAIGLITIPLILWFVGSTSAPELLRPLF